MKKILLLSMSLLLASCGADMHPAAPGTICDDALRGTIQTDYKMHDQCVNEVWKEEYRAGYSAADKYRKIPRGY